MGTKKVKRGLGLLVVAAIALVAVFAAAGIAHVLPDGQPWRIAVDLLLVVEVLGLLTAAAAFLGGLVVLALGLLSD